MPNNVPQSESENIRLSFVVPVFNEAETVSAFVDRVKAVFDKLDTLSLEIIFVNDGSSQVFDFKEENHIKILKLSNNSGVQVARNAGLSKARGEKIIFFDSDDKFYFDKIKILEDIKIESVGFCLPDIIHIVNDNLKKRRPIRSQIIRSYTRAPAPTSFLIFNKLFLDRNDISFDTNLLSSHDDDIYFNCLLNNSKPIKISHWGGFIHHDGSRITTSSKYKLGRKQFLEKYQYKKIMPKLFLISELLLVKFLLKYG